MVIKHLQIKRCIDIQVAIVGDGITQSGAILKNRTTHPSITGIIRGIAIHPVENRQLIQG